MASGLLLFLFVFAATPGSTQDLLLILCSGIIPHDAQRTVFDARRVEPRSVTGKANALPPASFL